MANHLSIARPYAIAAFEYAKEKHTLSAWKHFLDSASLVASHPAVCKLLTNPAMTSTALFDFFRDLLTDQISVEQQNFLSLLSHNNRLNMLPAIAELFITYCHALEKISHVRVVTAIRIEDSYRNKLTQALAKRIQRDVALQCDVDPSLLGGAIVHIGDHVIDGSIRGKLARLVESLTG